MSHAASPVLDPATPLSDLYRDMWVHARGARARLALALSLLGGSQLLKLSLPLMAAQAINAIQTQGRAGLQTAALWIGASLMLHGLSWALHGPARVLERGVALRVRHSVADALFARLLAAPLAWHDQHHSGDLQHRVGQASQALYGFTQTQFIYLQNFIQLVGPLVALYLLSPTTGGLALLGFCAVALAVLRFDRALMNLALRENLAERRYAARLLDFVGNISALASLRLQQPARRLLEERLLAVFKPLGRSIVLTEWKWCTVDLLTVALSWGLVVVYALHTLGAAGAGGTLLIGSLFMVHQYAQQASSVLGSMAAHYQGLAQTQADHASAGIVRTAPQCTPGPAWPQRWERMEWRQLGFAHAQRPDGRSRGGVERVDLSLRRGERLALVGPSGSGKSTLLRVLAGLYDAQEGQLAVDGVVHPGLRHAAGVSTLVPQETEVFEASLRENLCFGEAVDETDLLRAMRASAFDEVLASLPQGLDTPMSERGFNLSGGQRQRLALARGLLAARRSSLLLLDEPTSALDPLIEQHVQQRIGEAFEGSTLVAAVHRMGLLRHFDRVGLMIDGRLVDVGTADELQARQPVFAAMLQGPQAATGAALSAA